MSFTTPYDPQTVTSETKYRYPCQHCPIHVISLDPTTCRYCGRAIHYRSSISDPMGTWMDSFLCRACGSPVTQSGWEEHCSSKCLVYDHQDRIMKKAQEPPEDPGKEFARKEAEILHARADRLTESAKLWAERGEYLSAHSESVEADLLHSISWDMEGRYNGPYKVNRE